MAGKKGQKNPSRHKRKNRYSAGVVESVRAPEVFAFRVQKEYYDAVKADIEQRGLTKQQWCDEAVACMLGLDEEGEDNEPNDQQNHEQPPEDVAVTHPLVRDAIALAIAQKQVALKAQLKGKRPDQALVETWEKEIKELEGFLEL